MEWSAGVAAGLAVDIGVAVAFEVEDVTGDAVSAGRSVGAVVVLAAGVGDEAESSSPQAAMVSASATRRVSIQRGFMVAIFRNRGVRGKRERLGWHIDTLWRVTEIAGDFAEAWRRFERLESLVLSTETLEAEWTRGRTSYAALLVRITDSGVRQEIERTLRALEGIPGVDAYPEAYWHVTVKGLGFVVEAPTREDELSPGRLVSLAEEARPLLESTAAFEAVAGPAAGFTEVVILEVHDAGAVRALNTRLLETLPGVLRTPVDGTVFLPHISIARYSSQEGLGELRETLARLRAEPATGAPFEVAEVQLIVAHLGVGAPTFEVVETFRLAR